MLSSLCMFMCTNKESIIKLYYTLETVIHLNLWFCNDVSVSQLHYWFSNVVTKGIHI